MKKILSSSALQSLLLGSLVLLFAGSPLPLNAQAVIGPEMSGAWYDSSHDGEGFLLEVLDDGQVVVYWFTYDEAGRQRWFIGTGTAENETVVFNELMAASGALFGEEFDPDDVVFADIGQLTISWESCFQATASYIVNGEEGFQALDRLSSLAGLECSSAASEASPLSGSWFDHTHSGEGLAIEALPDGRVLIYWFSYDMQGNPAWFFGIGESEHRTITVAEMYSTSGGRFGAQFDPADVRLQPWGNLVVELGCTFGRLDYSAESAEFGSGKQTLARLTRPGDPDCDEPDPPNILLVIADDMGLDSSSQYSISNDLPHTPQLDRLAEQGLVFENAWSNPSCSPTRAGILTGKFGLRTGVLEAGNTLSTNETSLPSYIHQRLPGKYADAVIGKWHLGTESGNEDHPENLGIDHFSGILGGGVNAYDNWVLTTNGEQSHQAEYSTSKLTDLAIDWIDSREKPWFLWLAYNAPHTPFHLPPTGLHNRVLPGTEEHIARNPRPYYLAAIEAMDSEIGRLLDSMDEQTRGNTIIIFLGDNGTPGQVAQSPYERRKAKGSLYQGGINVPLFVTGPGVSRIKEREEALVNTTDLFSTIASLAGVNVSKVNDSISFAGLLTGTREQGREAQYSERTVEGIPNWALSDGEFKLIEAENSDLELYDLSNDPFEARELISQGAAPSGKVEELQSLIELIQIGR
jgi:arylsulfatase A-like enzyme